MRPTSPYTYLGAIGLVLLGWVASVAINAGAWDAVRDASLTPITEKQADASGHSLAVYTDIVQPDRDVACAATDGDEQATDVPPATIDLVIDADGAEWHLIGLLPRGDDGVTVTCTPNDDRTDNATYSFAVVDGFTSRGSRADLVAVLGLLAGAGLAGWTAWNRHAARSKQPA